MLNNIKLLETKVDEEKRTILVVQSGYIFKKKTEYLAASRLVTDFYQWVKLPNKTMINDIMSFQLDLWKKEGNK